MIFTDRIWKAENTIVKQILKGLVLGVMMSGVPCVRKKKNLRRK
jgi:hypothetical protein